MFFKRLLGLLLVLSVFFFTVPFSSFNTSQASINSSLLYQATSIADLKTLTPTQDSIVSVAGYYMPNDGGGGLFYWDGTSSESGNGGTIIAPYSDPSSGRWKRILTDNNINVKWFGAKADGVTDDTERIQTAIDSLPSPGGTVYLPGGDYRITSTLVIGNGDGGTTFSTVHGIKLIGDGAGFATEDTSKLLCDAAFGYAIEVKGRISDIHIENMNIACNYKAGGGVSFNSASGINMRNVKITHFTSKGLSIVGGGGPTGNYNIFNQFDNLFVVSDVNNTIGLFMDGNYQYQNDTWITSWYNCRFDTNQSENSTAAWFKFVDSNSFYRCHFSTYKESSHGIIFDALSNHTFPGGLSFYDCSVDDTIVLEDATHKIGPNYFYGNGTYDNEELPTHPQLKGITVDGNCFNMPIQPMSTTTANVAGNIQTINVGLNDNIVLPSGGTWEYDILVLNIGIGAFTRVVGVAPGGTMVCDTPNCFKFAKVTKLY